MKTKSKKLKRVCFVLQLKRRKIAEYKRRHKRVWPELLALLRRTGWHNFSIFVRGDGLLIGYVETPNFKKALAGLGASKVNEKWQKQMARMFETSRRPDESMRPVEEVFHLA
jgi:L-rhamnose mutarotase